MSSKLTTLQKYNFVLEAFHEKPNRTLDSYDEYLQEGLGLGQRQVERILKDLALEYYHIEEIKMGKRKAFKLIKPIDLLEEALDSKTDIGWLFSMVHEADPETFKQLEYYTDKKNSLYKFINTPFEDLSTIEEKDIFKKLKRAVKNREYVKIKFIYSNEVLNNLRCLKLIFIDNNWYISFITEQDKLRLGRISFIESVGYTKKEESFQPSKVKKHIDFIDNHLQNSMTLFEKKPTKATIKANKNISKYFEKNMKKFFPSQKFKKKLNDGSIIFTVNYTQSLEILPFIQKWLPDLIILEPQELKEKYLQKLQQTIQNHK